ncbi:MAG TPA: peptide chain release factor N(5)-glutamine methyltransferase [Clostridiales bacterium]|nr:peptide chain release factor N(5)-glutamine methyltransferase [Clostridiales bacterium]
MSTYKELLQTGKEMLIKQGIADADIDAWYLLAHVFKINRIDYLLRGDQEASREEAGRYISCVEERAKHVPLQHLTGTQEFMGLEFDVGKDVLIPRQDTELLVEEVLKVCAEKSVLDLCTGSGCIIISLAKLGGLKSACGVDISEPALEIAKRNAKKLGAPVEFWLGDLFQQIEKSYDIIVSNPPYIRTSVIGELMPEVKDHEPHLALDGSEDGLKFYRSIAAGAKEHLCKDGYLFLEVGYDQGKDVEHILLKEGYAEVMIKKDLSGQDRIACARFI